MHRLARPISRLAACVLGLAACGTPAGTVDHAATEGAESVNDSELTRLNARAREGAVTETLHGVEVEDPFRALEEDSPLTQEWVDAQTSRTTARLAAWTAEASREPPMAERLAELLSIGTIGGPHVTARRTFYTKREGDREQPAVYLREGGALREAPVIDPLTYGERASLDYYVPSPSGRYVAFGISSDGDERSTLRVLDVDSGEMLPDTIEHAKWSSVAWLHSETGFYFRRYPRAGEADYDAEHEDTYHLRLFFHALGADPADDVLVYSPPNPTDFPGAHVSADDRYVTISNFRGWSASDVFLLDRGRAASSRVNVPDEEHALVEVVAGQDHLYSGSVHGDLLYLVHNDGAPRYRVDAVAPASADSREAWQTVVPEGEGAIEGTLFLSNRIVVHYIEDIASKLRVFALDGASAGEIALPGRGEVYGLDGHAESGRIAFGFSSFVHPPALFGWSASSRELVEIDRVQTDVDFSQVELSQASVTSADGTAINVYYVHRRDMPRDGTARVLLGGYGGFNVSLLPGFQRNALYWIEQGGVFAVANLRGGGEHGEAWHRAGNLENKERVFEDFEAVIRWFGADSGISSPSRVAITGGSNGGLLMGAMITRCPDAFGATVSGVGLYDMLRYHRFPPAELWITEYGSADDATQFGWLHAYSPYHRVQDGTDFPAILITTADHDTRVHWGHSTKFTARLQEASREIDPNIYFFMVRQAGHGAGTPLSTIVERYVRLYTFIEHFLRS